MKKLQPIKSLGQNYLLDQNVAKKIIELLEPFDDRVVVEIGPGTGALTKTLIEKASNFIAIELDKRAAVLLKEEMPGLNLMNEDFLKIDLYKIHEHYAKTLRIIGNIPYNITSPILFKLIENNRIIDDAVLMTQYEVAKRITASKGSKDYSILSVVCSFFFDVKFCFDVSPNVFFPKPKVYSAVIKLCKKNLPLNFNAPLFISLVKSSFNNRRKTLKNSLKNSKFAFLINFDLNIDLNKRAEELSVDDFVELTKIADNLIPQNQDKIN